MNSGGAGCGRGVVPTPGNTHVTESINLPPCLGLFYDTFIARQVLQSQYSHALLLPQSDGREWHGFQHSATTFNFRNLSEISLVFSGTVPTPPTVKDSGPLAVVRLQNLLRIQGTGTGPTAVPGSSSQPGMWSEK